MWREEAALILARLQEEIVASLFQMQAGLCSNGGWDFLQELSLIKTCAVSFLLSKDSYWEVVEKHKNCDDLTGAEVSVCISIQSIKLPIAPKGPTDCNVICIRKGQACEAELWPAMRLERRQRLLYCELVASIHLPPPHSTSCDRVRCLTNPSWRSSVWICLAV